MNLTAKPMMNDESRYMIEDEGRGWVGWFRRLLPIVSSLLLLFVSYLPLDLAVLNNIRPSMPLICVYFWLLHRPDIFNLFSVYFLGFVDDIISSAPFGANIFTLLVLYLLMNGAARFLSGKSFVITWYGFGALALLTFFAKWLVVSIYYATFLPIVTVLFGYLATIAAYPAVCLLLASLQNKFLADDYDE